MKLLAPRKSSLLVLACAGGGLFLTLPAFLAQGQDAVAKDNVASTLPSAFSQDEAKPRTTNIAADPQPVAAQDQARVRSTRPRSSSRSQNPFGQRSDARAPSDGRRSYYPENGMDPFAHRSNRTSVYREMQKAMGVLQDEDKNREEKKEARESLADMLAAQFDSDLDRREAQVQELENKLSKLKAQIAKRRDAKDRIIELQMELMENEVEGLGFPGSWPTTWRNAPTPTGLFDGPQKLGPNWAPAALPGTSTWLATPVPGVSVPNMPRLPADARLPAVARPAAPPTATGSFDEPSR